MDLLLLAVLGVLVVVAVTAVSTRIGIAAPLLLVAVGVLASFVPGVPRVVLSPEVILAGILPPLLYASSVNMPTMDFRRDLRSIGGLSVGLVLASACLMGWLLPYVVPGIGFAEAFALGAIVSPTDAVATSIVRRTGVAPRLVTLLEGESMLNDATALVLLRSAVAAMAASVSLWEVVGGFVQAVVVAVVVGVLVAAASLLVRALVDDATVATAVSFVVSFLAYAPSERLGGSGLVAVVVAGLVIGSRSLVDLRAEDRLAEAVNWRTIAFILEGGVFLLMGLELRPLVDDFEATGHSWGRLAAVTALVLVVLWSSRLLFVGQLIWFLRRRRPHREHARTRIASLREYLQSEHAQSISRQRRERALQLIRRREADLAFYDEQPLGGRAAVVLSWAGMRGAVTVAAAKTLPADTGQRPLLVLAAFCVAGASLLVQGGTLGLVVRTLGVEDDRVPAHRAQMRSLLQTLEDVTDARCDEVLADGFDGRSIEPEVVEHVRRHATPQTEGEWAGAEGAERERRLEDYRALRRAVLDDQREALLEVRRDGTHDSSVLGAALARLDAIDVSVSREPRPARDSGDLGPS